MLKAIKNKKNKKYGTLSLLKYYGKRNPFIIFALIISSLIYGASTIMISIVMTSIVSSLNVEEFARNHSDLSPFDLAKRIKENFDTNIIISSYENGVGYSKFLFLEFDAHQWVWGLFILFFIIIGSLFISVCSSGHFGKIIQIGLRNDAMKSLINQDISFYSESKIGESITKLTSDTMIIGDNVEVFLCDLVSSITIFIFGFSILFLVDYKIGSIISGIVIIIIIAIVFSVLITEKMVAKLRKTITEINGFVTDRVATIRLIKTTATEKSEQKNFKEIHKKYIDETKRNEYVRSGFSSLIWTCISSIQIIILILVAFLYKEEEERLNLLVTTFVSVISILISPIVVLLKMIPDYIITKTSINRINTFILSKPRFNFHYDDGIIINKIEGNIIFKDIVFAYPEKPKKIVLPEFNFTFEQGKSYAFVGETGSGKSTISRLLLRFYDPTHGNIYLNNNVNLKDVNLSSFLNRVGYVEQEPQIIFGNVLDNIKYSQNWKTDEEAIEASKNAMLHDIVMSWPNQYETILGERGFMLSGGQKQRLVIARTFLKDPDILIFDEATSALDNVTEKEIQIELNKLALGKTTITIAHRLSTIKNCDEIIVLGNEKGIVQRGNFKSLIKIDGHFKKLYEAGKLANES